jgi:hypothetical protein
MEVERQLSFKEIVALPPTIKDVPVGGCFRRLADKFGNVIFMRVEILKQIYWEPKVAGRTFPVVNLVTGSVYCIPEFEQIVPVIAKVVYVAEKS